MQEEPIEEFCRSCGSPVEHCNCEELAEKIAKLDAEREQQYYEQLTEEEKQKWLEGGWP